MPERGILVTLISKGQARIGDVFIHKGPSPKCRDCSFFEVCIRNPRIGRVYKIVKVREKTLPCHILDTQMAVVEIEEASIIAAIPSKLAVEGAVIMMNETRCDLEHCENTELCFPIGLGNADRCQILSVNETLSCPLNLSLKIALVRPLDS